MRKLVSIGELKDFLQSHSGLKTAITFHSLGDTDSVSSAIALSENFYGSIFSSDRITRNSERILENMGCSNLVSQPPLPADTQLVIMVDVNNFEGCGQLAQYLKGFNGEILIIDHHAATEMASEAIAVFDDETYTSTASIILELLHSAGKTPTTIQRKLLLMGIISDSAEFRNSDSRTFSQIGEILKSLGESYPDIIEEMTFRSSPKH